MVSNASRARKAPTCRIFVCISSCLSHWKIATEIDSHVFKITLPTKPSHTTTSTGSSKRWRPSMLPTKLIELFFSILKTSLVIKMLKKSSLNFVGNIEGRHLFEDPVEVEVCDGFVGNVILKTCESIAGAIFKWLRHELNRFSA